jgi:hypothetical protein
LPPKEPRRALLIAYYIAWVVIIALGLVLLGYQYIGRKPPTNGAGDLILYVATSGYTVVIAGVLVCLLVALMRWRTAEYDDGRRPKFTAGVAIVVVGAVLMLGAAYALGR